MMDRVARQAGGDVPGPARRMAKRQVAFLRAINVGGHTVRMNELREHFEDLGFDDVATFIASGNVIFEAAGGGRRLETRIERHLEERLGYEVATFVRSIDELEAVPADVPFAPGEIDGDGHRLYVGFLRESPGSAATAAVRALASDVDALDVVGRELYWLSRVSMRDSPVTGARLEKLIGGPATLRSINTVNRLIAKYGR
jgi:uncharacterized protein (DUF1697 family)